MRKSLNSSAKQRAGASRVPIISQRALLTAPSSSLSPCQTPRAFAPRLGPSPAPCSASTSRQQGLTEFEPLKFSLDNDPGVERQLSSDDRSGPKPHGRLSLSGAP